MNWLCYNAAHALLYDEAHVVYDSKARKMIQQTYSRVPITLQAISSNLYHICIIVNTETVKIVRKSVYSQVIFFSLEI